MSGSIEHEEKSLLAYVKEHTDAFTKKLTCPNHSDGIKFQNFENASVALMGSFSEAVNRYYAEKWK